MEKIEPIRSKEKIKRLLERYNERDVPADRVAVCELWPDDLYLYYYPNKSPHAMLMCKRVPR